MVCSNDNAHEIPRAKRVFETISGRVRTVRTTERLWDSLTPGDRLRLGDDFDAAYAKFGGAVGMWKHLRGVSTQRSVMDLAKRFSHVCEDDYHLVLRVSGEVPEEPGEIPESAMSPGHLVLIENPRAAFWSGKAITIDWFKSEKPWRYFWKLASGAKTGTPIDRFEFGEDLHHDYLTKQKCRLVNLKGFPVDLGEKIVSKGRGSQTLDLKQEHIRVIESHLIEVARELLG
jgi:hypothetical protein